MLQAFALNLSVTLSGDEWVPEEEGLAALVLGGLTAELPFGLEAEPAGWNALFPPLVAAGAVGVVRHDGRTLSVLLPPVLGYQVGAAETIRLVLPAAAMARGVAPLAANPSVVVRPSVATLSGSLTGGVDEQEVRDGLRVFAATGEVFEGQDFELVISLQADSFVEELGTDGPASAALLAGLGTSLRHELSWHHLTRVGARELRVTIPPQPSFDITSPEVATVVVPAAALHSNVSLLISPSFAVRAVSGAATLYPPFMRGEAALQQYASYVVRIDLSGTDDAWAVEVGQEGAASTALLQGFVARSTEPSGWNVAVRPSLRAAQLRRVTDYRVELTLSGYPAYEIAEPETIYLSLPADALRSGMPSFAGGAPFVVAAARGSAVLSGSVVGEHDVDVIASVEGGLLRYTLSGDSFVPTLGQSNDLQNDACTSTLISELDALGTPQSLGWTSVVQSTLREQLSTVVVRESASSLAIELPQLLVYRLDQAETITTLIPAACLRSGSQLRAEHISGAPWRMLPPAGRAFVSGSLLQQASEAELQALPTKLEVSLQQDTFLSDAAGFLACISGSLGGLAGGWEAAVQPALTPSMVSFTKVGFGVHISLDIPASPAYSIAEPETIRVLLPSAFLASEQDVLASPSFVLQVAGANDFETTGSLTRAGVGALGGVDEALLASATLHNLTFALQGDTWLNNAPSAAILRALVSAQSEPHGWNAVVRPALGLQHLTLLNNATAHLAFRGPAAYDITAPETISVEVPADAVQSSQPVPVVSTFVIRADAGGLSISGGFVNASNELNVVGVHTQELTLTLDGSSWAAGIGADESETLQVLRAIVAQEHEAAGWNAVVRPALRARDLVRLSDTQLRISLPQIGRYSIEEPETLDVFLPAEAQSSNTNLSARTALAISPQPAELAISGGSLLRKPREASVQQSDTTLVLALLGDAWRDDLAPNASTGLNPARAALTAALLTGFSCAQNEPAGWNAVVAPLLLAVGRIERRSATELVVTIPRAAAYAIDSPETITVAALPQLVRSRVAPRAYLPSLVLLPTRGTAAIMAPGIATERHLQLGARRAAAAAVDDGTAAEAPEGQALAATEAAYAAYVAGEAPGMSLRIALEADEWRAGLLAYAVEEYEECIYLPKDNTTFEQDMANISLCNGSFANVSNASNGSCAYTNASGGIAWGYPYRVESAVTPGGDPSPYLSAELQAQLLLGGSGWAEALYWSRLGDQTIPTGWARRLEGLFDASNASNASNATPVPPSAAADECVITRLDVRCEAAVGLGARACHANNGTNGSANSSNASHPHANASAYRYHNSCNASVPGPENCTLHVRRIYPDHIQELLDSIVSAQADPGGWNARVRPTLRAEHLSLDENGTLALSLPPQHEYDIAAPERLKVRLPASALASGQSLFVNGSATVDAAAGRVGLSGSLLTNAHEEAVRSPAEYTLVLTLTDDAWRPEVGQEGEAASEALLASILAAQNEPRGWNAVVRPQLRSRELTRLSDAVVTLTLLQFMEYEVSMPETVGLVVPAESVVSAQPVTCCNASFVLMPERGRVALGGSALGLLSEGRLRHASEPSFTITLSGDTWAPNVTAPNSSLRRQLVAGISAVTPRRFWYTTPAGNLTLGTNYTVYHYTGWDDVLRPALGLARLDDATLRVTLPAAPAYDIWADEIVQLSLAPELLRSRNPPVFRPKLRLIAASVAAYGSLLVDARDGGAAHEYAVQNHSTSARVPLAEPPTIALVLSGDEWVADLGLWMNEGTFQLLNGLTSLQNTSTGWNNVVRPALRAEHVTRMSAHTVRVTLPKLAAYDISSPETLEFTVPPSAVLSAQSLAVPYALTIMPTPGHAELTGRLLDTPTEVYMSTSLDNRTITVQLTADRWMPSLVPHVPYGEWVSSSSTKGLTLLVAGLGSVQAEPLGFNALINRSAIELRLTSDTVLELVLPPTPLYDVASPETVLLTVPPEAVVSRGEIVAAPALILRPSPGTPSVVDDLTGEPLLELRELALQSNVTTLVLRVVQDAFVPTIGTDDTSSVSIIDAFLSQQSEPGGWNAVVLAQLAYTELTLSDDATEVAIAVPVYPAYDILSPETLRIHLPVGVLLSGQAVKVAASVVVRATPGTAHVSGTLTRRGADYYGATACCGQENFLQVATSAPTLIVTLKDDIWEPGIENGGEAFTALIANIVARSAAETSGWNEHVRRVLRPADIQVSDVVAPRDTLTITLPPLPGYAIDAPEVIDVVVPMLAIVSRAVVPASPAVLVRASPGVPSLNGTLISRPAEGTLQKGPSTIDISVVGDRFAGEIGFSEDGPAAAAANALLLAGLRSTMGLPGSNVDGLANESVWNTLVMGELYPANISRLDNATVRISLPAYPTYEILLPEFVRLRIDRTLVLSNATLLIPVAFTVMPTAGSATLGGPALHNISEAEIAINRTVNLQLFVTLHADTWQPGIGLDLELTGQLLRGLRAVTDEEYGWNNVVSPGLLRGLSDQFESNMASPLLERLSDHELVLLIPMFREYQITVPEVVVLTIPHNALTSNQTIVALPSIRVPAVPGSALISGALLNATDEDVLRQGAAVDHRGVSFNLTLSNDSWVPGVGGSAWYERELSLALLRAIVPTGTWGVEEAGWQRVVRPALLAPALTNDELPLVRVDDYTIAFVVGAAPDYNIVAPETLAIHIPRYLVLADAPIIAEPAVTLAAIPGTASVDGSLLCFEGRYVSVWPPPVAPPPPFEEYVPALPPPSSPPTPPLLPPWPPGEAPPEQLCKNTEAALSDPLISHELNVYLANESWVPPLLATLGGHGEGLRRDAQLAACHDAVGCAADALFAGLRASSWLHGTKNISEQMADPLLSGGWNAVVQRALRLAMPQGEAHLAHLRAEGVVAVQLSYGQLDEYPWHGFYPPDAPPSAPPSPLEPPLPPGLAAVTAPSPPFAHLPPTPPNPPSETWAAITVRDAAELSLRFAGHPDYSIWVPETISITLPAAAVRSNITIEAAPQIIIWASPGALAISGSLKEDNAESTLASASTMIVLRLEGDLWMPGIGRIACASCPEPGGLDTTRGLRLDESHAYSEPTGCPCIAGDPTGRYTDSNASLGLIASLSAMTSVAVGEVQGNAQQPSGWNAVVMPQLLDSPLGFFPKLWRVDDATLNLTIPQQLGYDIDIPESVSLVPPREYVLSNQPNKVDTLVIMPTAGKASINGSLLFEVDEVKMRDVTRKTLTLYVTLQNDSWVESLGQGPNDATRAFAAGIKAAEGNLNTCQEYASDGRLDEDGAALCTKGGWMATVQPSLRGPTGYVRIARLSELVVRVTLEGVPAYDIFGPDLLEVHVPPQAVLSDQRIVAPTQIRIDATPGQAIVSGGSLLATNREIMLQEHAFMTIEVHMVDDAWVAELGTPAGMATNRALLAGFVSAQSEAGGWNAVVSPALLVGCTLMACPSVTRVTDQLARITLPQLTSYDITLPETLQLTVPKRAVLSDQVVEAQNTFRVRATPGTATLAGSLLTATRMGLAGHHGRWETSLEPVREAEVVAGELLYRRNVSLTPQFNGTGYPIEDQVEFLEEGDALKVEVTLNNDTWVLKTDSGSGDIYMDVALKRLLVLGLSSDLAECTGWNAAVRADPDAVRVQAFNERKLTMTLPRLAGYDIRVPETVTLVVPGATVASDEDIDASPGGEANAFVLRPDTPAADRLEVGALRAGGSASGSLKYYSEEWYMLDVPADHGMVLSVDVEWNEEQQRYGALHMQAYEDETLLHADYTDCANTAPDCGDGGAATGGGGGGGGAPQASDSVGFAKAACNESEPLCDQRPTSAAGTSCRCVRRDLELGRRGAAYGTSWEASRATRVYDSPHVVYETASLGYGQGAGGTGCITPRKQLWLALRCVVDVCGGECKYTVRLDALPYFPEFDAQVTAPLGSGEWHYFNLRLGGFDTLEVFIERLADRGTTPDYRLDAAPWPPPAPVPPPAPTLPGGATAPAAPNLTDAANATNLTAAAYSMAASARRLATATTAATQAVAVAVVRLGMSEHGLVGAARSSLGVCPTLDASQQQAEVGINTAANSASTFCTDASQAGQLYIGVYAEPSMNNVSLPPRHWYKFRLDHTVFDTSDLLSGEMRTGCLAYGQWRHYKITTAGINDARLDLEVNLGVTALYARRGAMPTATEHDAHAAWPLRRLSLTHCDVAAETDWYVAVYLGPKATALVNEPALLALGGSAFELSATLRTSNMSLTPFPRGTQRQVPPAYVCCGSYHDYIVPRVTRALALKVEVKVHSGHLSAVYLKHAACARYPADVGPDEQCVGNCEMGWLTTFNQFTLDPSYADGVVLTVPMGTFSPDIRAAGDWCAAAPPRRPPARPPARPAPSSAPPGYDACPRLCRAAPAPLAHAAHAAHARCTQPPGHPPLPLLAGTSRSPGPSMAAWPHTRS